MAERHIADKESQFVAVNDPPDLCRVGKRIVPFDITDRLSLARDPSPDVFARGGNVLTVDTRVNTVQGDAGRGIRSGVSRGHSIVLDGSPTVYVNGKHCARHNSAVGMNCNTSDVYNTTGHLQTLQMPPKPEWGSPDKGRELAARLGAVREKLHNNPMGKGMEEARALQAEVTSLVGDAARHEQAVMQGLRSGETSINTLNQAIQVNQGARNLIEEAARQVRWANPTNQAVANTAIEVLVPGAGLPDAYGDWQQARQSAQQGNWMSATGQGAMAVVGVVTEVPGLKWIKGLVKGKKALEGAEEVKDAVNAAEAASKAAAAKKAEAARSDGVVITPPPPGKLKAGTPEHKQDRWEKYQARGGKKTYDQWSKQYDTNMRNYQHGAAREALYRQEMGVAEGTVKTPLTSRQIDLLDADNMYAGQLKSGPVSLTKENVIAIAKDAELVKSGWNVEHILEKGASRPYLDALDRAGVKYHIGPKIGVGNP